MEQRVRVLPSHIVMEPLLALLEEVEAVPLVISGGSMTPFLVHGRDTVYLSRADKPLKKGDMALYQRCNGAYVLHRVYKVNCGMYTMVGDAQTHTEPGIRPEQIRAVVTAVRRKDQLLQKGSFWWFFFEKIWIRALPLRPIAKNIYCAAKKCFAAKE